MLKKYLDRGKVYKNDDKKQREFQQNAKRLKSYERLLKHEANTKAKSDLSLDQVGPQDLLVFFFNLGVQFSPFVLF